MRYYKILLFLSLILILIGCTSKTELSEEDLIEIVQPEIDNYCEELGEISELTNNEDPHKVCPTCTSFGRTYEISESEGNFLVSVEVRLMYEANNKPGSSTLTFVINEKGVIIEKNFPIKTCL